MSDKSVTIGGLPYGLPETVFLGTIKAFNPALKELKALQAKASASGVDLDLIDVAVIAAQIVGETLRKDFPTVTPQAIEDKLLPAERPGLLSAMWEILIASGLFARKASGEGEAKPPETPAADQTPAPTSAA